MSKPVLLYFNLRARSELPRLVAAVGGVDYVDQRVTFDEWPKLYKSKTPYGQIPVLIVDGKYYAEKLAISLYFARIAGLYPKSGDPLEFLKYDHILQFTEEVLEQIVQSLVENAQGKPEKLSKLKVDILDKKVPLIEKILKENGTGFFVGNKLSIVDLSAFDVAEHITDIQGKSYLDSYPLFKAHFERVGKIDSLKKYIASRPPPEAVFNF